MNTLWHTKHVEGDHFLFADIPGGITAQAIADASITLQRISELRNGKAA